MSQHREDHDSAPPDGAKPTETILDQWRRERPDIDPAPMAVCGEIWRAGERLHRAVHANLSNYNLDFPGFDVILTLRRQGVGQALTPSVLAKEMMLSTSAMTNRLDRLEKRGLIARSADPKDRRAMRIVLTDEGFRLAEEIFVSHVETEERMLSALTEEERAIVRHLMVNIGQQD